MRIEPSRLSGKVVVPSSKSVGHRLLICAALAKGLSKIYGLSMSKDIVATLEALKGFGAEFLQMEDARGETYWQVKGLAKSMRTQTEDRSEPICIFCGESGSTLRFMIPVAMSVSSLVCFEGEGRLVERPIDEYFAILDQNSIIREYDGRLPMTLKGRLRGGAYQLSGKVSSQYTTGLLLAAPMLEEMTLLTIIDEMESKGYIDLTVDCMKQFGVEVLRQGYQQFEVTAGQGYCATEVFVEGDYSQAAFWIVAGLIGEAKIGLRGLRKDSQQGDMAVLEVVARMGGGLEWRDEMLWVSPSDTRGTIIDASQCPDLIPVLCVLGALSDGETRVVNGQRLRVKESDRITATVTELKKLGATIEETEDGMVIQGVKSLRGGCGVAGWNDHRIVMAMAVAATRCQLPIEINGTEAVAKSYPHFFEDYRALGGVAIEGGEGFGQCIWQES